MSVSLEPIGGILVAGAVGVAVLVLGVRLGMLVAPRLARWAERDDEEDPGDGSEGA